MTFRQGGGGGEFLYIFVVDVRSQRGTRTQLVNGTGTEIKCFRIHGFSDDNQLFGSLNHMFY